MFLTRGKLLDTQHRYFRGLAMTEAVSCHATRQPRQGPAVVAVTPDYAPTHLLHVRNGNFIADYAICLVELNFTVWA